MTSEPMFGPIFKWYISSLSSGFHCRSKIAGLHITFACHVKDNFQKYLST